MAPRHTVQQGECLAGIAQQHGFGDWRALYDLPENAELKEKRPNPNLLLPGDVVHLPESQPSAESTPAGQKHRFVRKGKKAALRLVLENEEGEPYADLPYELDLGSGPIEGTTDGKGLLAHEITHVVQRGSVKIWSDGAKTPDTQLCEIALEIGGLDPIDEISGIQARLQNLAYDCGPIDGIDGPKTRAGVKAFQRDREIEVDGIAGPITQGELEQAHGC